MFVSSRRQTRLTALDLIGYAAGDERPRQFVHCPEPELDQAVAAVQVGDPLHGCDFRYILAWDCPGHHPVSSAKPMAPMGLSKTHKDFTHTAGDMGMVWLQRAFQRAG